MVGRKRTFSEEQALEAAMDVFWRKGYTGASLSELTQSMGINKPSMYATFGNKEALFVKATSLYIEKIAKPHTQWLFEEGTRLEKRVKNYMLSIVKSQCESDDPKGCYVILCQSEIAGGDMPQAPTELLNEAGQYIQKLLTELFLNDPQAIRLGLNHQASSAALSIATTLRGTASMARAKVTFAELQTVIEHCLKGIGINSDGDKF
ncbi:TetR/AcrR family transcriptional regulator [Catenovulum sediminis]|uniref:TetR/AcrR family transcriptional regulator n=1 Tax=Catenovulum sediminis TaxID=1740262 RepID=A0ABV1RGL9_9ALTE